MNNMADLNEYLFQALDAITNDDLTDEQLTREIRKSEAITKIAETVIRNGELALKTMMHLNEYGYNDGDVPVPEMLRLKGAYDRKPKFLGGAINSAEKIHPRNARLHRSEHQRATLRRTG